MKKVPKNILYVALLFSMVTATIQADCGSNNSTNGVVTTFVPRSQGRDKAYIVSGQAGKVDLFDMCSFYANANIGVEYQRSFRPGAIADCLFGPFLIDNATGTTNSCNDSCNNSSSALLIQGSAVSGTRNAKALVAENFYLPSDFSSVVSFSPRITNVLVNFDAYVGLDGIMNGLYARFYGPFVHTRWKLGFDEVVTTSGINPAAAGQYSEAAITRANLLANFADYAGGKTINSTTGNAAPAATAVAATTFDGLRYAQMFTCDTANKNGFAELRAELGWNVWACDDGHVGFNVQMAFPTGPGVKACRLFEPRIGNDKWELGGGMTGHYTFWRSECEDNSSFGFYFDANVTHLFKGREVRTFDLKNKPLSRYMLAERFASAAQTLTGSATAPTIIATPPTVPVTAALFQFANEFSPVANLTTRDVKVSVGVEADIVAWFNLSYCSFSWDLGYNFWGRTREKIHTPSTDTNCTSDANICRSFVLNNADTKWGLKGNVQVIGFAGVAGNAPIRLSATQSLATINGVIANGTLVTGTINTGADAPQFAFSGTGANTALVNAPGGVVGTANIETSIQPVFLTEADIDYGTTTRGLSHKVFTNLQYNFEGDCWSPYVGIGGFGEFGSRKNSDCNDATTTVVTTNANDCNSSSIRCALSQWGVWVKGGVSFN